MLSRLITNILLAVGQNVLPEHKMFEKSCGRETKKRTPYRG